MLRRTLSLLLFFGLAIATAVGILIFKPQWLINSKTAAWILPRLIPSDFKIHWDSIELEVTSNSSIEKQIRIKIEGLDLRLPLSDVELRATGTDLEIGALIRWDRSLFRGPRLVRISPLRLEVERLRVLELGHRTHQRAGRARKSNARARAGARSHGVDQSEANQSDLWLGMPVWLRKAIDATAVDGLGIRIQRWTVSPQGAPPHWAGELKISQKPKSSAAKGFVRADGPGRTQIRAELQFQEEASGNLVLVSRLWARIRERDQIESTMSLKWSVQDRPSLLAIPRNGNLAVEGNWKRSGGETRLKARRCHLNWRSERRAARSSSPQIPVSVKCSISLRTPIRIPSPLSRIALPEEFTGDLSGRFLVASRWPSPAAVWDGFLSAQVSDWRTPWLRADELVLKSAVRLVPIHPVSELEWEPHLSGRFGSDSFSALLVFLEQSELAIPAPVNELDGPIELSFRGRRSDGRWRLLFTLGTQLRSVRGSGQVLITRTEGKVDVGHSDQPTRIQATVAFEDAQINLPRLSLEGLPPLIADSRIRSQRQPNPQAQRQLGFEFDLRLIAPAQAPLRVWSNLAKEPAPVSFDLSMGSHSEPSGRIDVMPFRLSVFRRDTLVEEFGLRLAPGFRTDTGSSRGELRGALKVAFSDYWVRARVAGPIEKPRISLISDPPLTEPQIYSVLLFGRPLEELEGDQGVSVGNVRSAAADGAIGFASLYFLASTPVESVGYDPQLNLYSAKIRLGEGTSLSFGGGGRGEWDEGSLQRLGVRRRLSGHWRISTDLIQRSSGSTGGADHVVSAFLEWTNRY